MTNGILPTSRNLLPFKDLHFNQVYIQDVLYTVEAEMFIGIYIRYI